MSAAETNTGNLESAPNWRPLSPRQRRVVGVLVEKAKTTRDAYPMTVNAIVAGCNQKNNRDPLTNYSAEDVEEVLAELRQLGAVVEVQQSSRVPRYRHCLYEWLGVDKVELAVMAELLLRGEQTVGELRGRAARMEPIPDLNALRPVLDSLIQKKLVVSLTPPGRGQIVTHGLYKEREWNELRERYASGAALAAPPNADAEPQAEADAEERSALTSAAAPPAATGSGVTADMFAELQLEVAELRAEIARLRQRLERLES